MKDTITDIFVFLLYIIIFLILGFLLNFRG